VHRQHLPRGVPASRLFVRLPTRADASRPRFRRRAPARARSWRKRAWRSKPLESRPRESTRPPGEAELRPRRHSDAAKSALKLCRECRETTHMVNTLLPHAPRHAMPSHNPCSTHAGHLIGVRAHELRRGLNGSASVRLWRCRGMVAAMLLCSARPLQGTCMST
jgi:hypothetical protein